MISDNGPQFIARDFKEFIRISGMTHVRTSPYYPQSNGKIERWHKSLKPECIRPLTPLTLDDARRLIQAYVDRYNTVRLHSAIGYRELHRQVLQRDGWRCQVCGSMQHLQVHHLKFRSHSGGDEEQNLITLCDGCHAHIH